MTKFKTTYSINPLGCLHLPERVAARGIEFKQSLKTLLIYETDSTFIVGGAQVCPPNKKQKNIRPL